MDDLISKQAAIDALNSLQKFSLIDSNEYLQGVGVRLKFAVQKLEQLPYAQPEIIRCRDCRWWDKYGDYDNGYCMAAKHGYWSEHWEISIRRKYKGDFYCADAEPKEEQE